MIRTLPSQDILSGQIVPPRMMLRPVREDSVEFLNLMDSLADNGFMNSICVREHPQRPNVFEVIDGLWRLSAAKKLDIPKIPCILKVGVTDDKLLELQIQANAVRYETSPVEFAEHMHRLIRIHEDVGAPLTVADISRMVGQQPNWVSTRLKLINLSDYLKEKLTSKKLTLGKAVALSKIKGHDLQDAFANEHEFGSKPKMIQREFELAVGRFINEKVVNSARRPSVYKPRLQSMNTLLNELDSLENVSQLITETNAQTAIEGAKLMIEFVLSMDALTRENRVKKGKSLSRLERLELIRRQRYKEFEDCD